MIDYGTTTIRGLNAKGLDINAITLPINFDESETTDLFMSIKNENEDNGGLIPVEHPNGIHELSISLASDREYELASNGITISTTTSENGSAPDEEILNEIISSIQSDKNYSSFPFVIEANAANDAIRLIYKKDAPSVSDATLTYTNTASSVAVQPSSYDMKNGSSGSYNYWDESYDGLVILCK